ncbi:deoxyribose-phosphate aldolase, partial [bacterium]|nr:deoxyribose-phosphate aldolase [bacterium]
VHVKRAKKELEGTEVLVATVIGFPLGANISEVKAFETNKAIGDGADEIDMVLNVGAMKSGDHELVEKDIRMVVEAAAGKTVKVILETCLLTDEEKIKASLLSKRAGAHFVKTSTGFSSGGATYEDVYLMKQTVGDSMEVKASGGVRDVETAAEMIKLGATRLGTSSGLKIVSGEKGGSNDAY